MFSQFEVRQSFLDFFVSKNHQVYPSASLIPPISTGLLFINAGMNPFKDIFCGLEKHPQSPRIVNSQKCMRISGKHNDLEEVGLDTYHHTFFEMLGNWSFNDYGKEQAILFSWELLTQVWKIPTHRLFVTYYHQDEETALIWKQKVGLPQQRVLPFGKKDNFWEMGQIGPCGPCTEIHIWDGIGDLDLDIACDPKRGVNSGSVEFIEIWNLVFIQNLRHQDGSISKLSKLYVDTGMGLERIVSTLQKKNSNYDTDLFFPILSKISELSGCSYEGPNQIPMRVIADHIRSICFSIADGITPSNEGRGYVVRRILRRALRYGKQLGLQEPFLYMLVPSVVDLMSKVYPRLSHEQLSMQNWILQEENLFGATLSRGLEYFYKLSSQYKSSRNTTFSGKNIFILYDTYGFPVDLTGVLCKEEGLQVDEQEFEEYMNQQKIQSSLGAKKNIFLMEDSLHLPKTIFMGEDQETVLAKFIWSDQEISSPSSPNKKQISLVFDQTVLYAEGGGQVSDVGIATGNCPCSSQTKFVIHDVQKQHGIFFHRGVFQKICSTHPPTREDSFFLQYDLQRRRALVRNHTATHLLHQALRDVLGPQVKQNGSLVDVERLRFDFTFPHTPSEEQLLQVEKIVNHQIEKNYPVTVTVTSLEEAKKMGALAFFEDRYGKLVRVVNMGNYSIELCGGTHAHFLGDVGLFTIDGVRSVASGVKRIQAKTGPAVYQEYLLLRQDLKDSAIALSAPEQSIKLHVQNLILDLKSLKDFCTLVYQTLLSKDSLLPFLQQAPWENSSLSLQHFLVFFFPSISVLQKSVAQFGIPLTKKSLINWVTSPILPRIIVSGSISDHMQLVSHPLDGPAVIHICWNLSPQTKSFNFLFVNKNLGSDVHLQWLDIDPLAIAKRLSGKFKATCHPSQSLFRISNIQADPQKNFSSQVLSEFWKALEHATQSIFYVQKSSHEEK